MTTRRATSLRPGQFKHLIRVASVTGRQPDRDVMLLWLTHTTGIRVTELALLEVADVLYPSGAIKPEVYLRAEITKACRARNVYLTHARCLAALDAWLGVRLQRRWGLSGADEYRGLRPGSKLVMTHKGQAFELAFKHRMLDSGPEVYRACDSLQQTISRLYRQAGIKHGSSHSGRRSLAAKPRRFAGAPGKTRMNNWKPWVRSKGRPVTGLVDVRYLDGKEFLRKLAQDCYWGADSLIEFWREAQENDA